MNVLVLHNGNCERLKAGTHALALCIAAVCGVYNLAAWLVRRQRHLAINAALYAAATVWEVQHVRHHLAECAPREEEKPTPERLPAAS